MWFRNRPDLAPTLLRDALHVELPDYTEVRIESAELSVVPTEYRADLVVLLASGKPGLGIVVEVPLAEDARKRFRARRAQMLRVRPRSQQWGTVRRGATLGVASRLG
jgi:hypothetical protein